MKETYCYTCSDIVKVSYLFISVDKISITWIFFFFSFLYLFSDDKPTWSPFDHKCHFFNDSRNIINMIKNRRSILSNGGV